MIKVETGMGLKGRVEWLVINADGSIAQEGKQDNLILNQGLDQVAEYYLAAITAYCAVGTDNTVAAVTDVGLGVESARTNTVITSPTGATGSTWSDNTTCNYKRTFQFDAGELNGTYREAGFSPEATVGNNLFSRIIFTDAGVPVGVPVSSAQELRVVYTLTVSLAPSSHTASSAVITNIGTVNFTHAIQSTVYAGVLRNYLCTTALSGLAASGIVDDEIGTDYGQTGALLEPANNRNGANAAFSSHQVLLYSDNEPLTVVGEYSAQLSNLGYVPMGSGTAYISSDYYKDFSVTFSTNNGNSSSIYGLAIGGYQTNTTTGVYGHVYRVLFNPPIEKLNTHELTLTVRFTWNRV